jgi:hypothetical protein
MSHTVRRITLILITILYPAKRERQLWIENV